MSEIKVGSTVESMTSEGALTVKILGRNQVVAQDETGQLEIYPPDELYVVPGHDYCRLRRTVVDTMDKLSRDGGHKNINSTRFQLALSRALYAADVRRGDDDMVNHLQTKITMVVTDSVASGPVADMIRKNINTTPVFTPVNEVACDMPEALRHTSLEGHDEMLVQQLTDDELALMCCDVADMLANGMGFTADMSYLDTSLFAGLSDLQRRITYWTKARGNVRKSQVWSMAQKVVGHCRMAEVDDAIENVLEAVRQQEDCDD